MIAALSAAAAGVALLGLRRRKRRRALPSPSSLPSPSPSLKPLPPLPPLPPHVAAAWAWYARAGSPRYFAAPLVGRSDVAWRCLVRRHGTHVASTPMIDAAGFARSAGYRAQWQLGVFADDAPLIVQLGGGVAADVAAAAAFAAEHCDVVEL